MHTTATPAASEIATRYLAAWNETDAKRRLARVSEAFAEDAQYLDPLMRGQGHAGLADMIGAAQAHFPGLRFSLHGTPEAHNGRLRFSWALGPEGAAPVARGTDFCTLHADGRLHSVTGFVDQAPA